MISDKKAQEFWDEFLKKTGRTGENGKAPECYSVFMFTDEKKIADELLALVLAGKKKATSSSLWEYAEDEPLPQAGDFNIVTDGDGTPRCVIMTTAVTIIPFGEMTFEVCSREGEDECLETWRESHLYFFGKYFSSIGKTMTEDMPVVFEDFEVIYVK